MATTADPAMTSPSPAADVVRTRTGRPARPTGARAGSRPRRRPASRGVRRRARSTRVPSWMTTPRSRATRRRPRARMRRLDRRRPGHERPGAQHRRRDPRLDLVGGSARRTGPPPRASRQASTASCHFPSWAGAALTESAPRLRVPGVDPCAADQRPSSSTAPSIARAAATRALDSPYRSISVGSSSHQPVTNPPLRPDGPPPQMSASSRTTRAPGASSASRSAVHSPV